MKKLLIGCMLSGTLLINSVVPVSAVETTAQTDISITLVRQVSAGSLPGIEESHKKPSSITIAKPAIKPVSGKNLPKTNEQIETFYPFLGFTFIGCSWILWHFRDRKEER